MNFFRIHFRRLVQLMVIVLLSTGIAQAETTETKPAEKNAAEIKSEPTCIAIVGTNDLHGAVQPQTLEVGEQNVLRGGHSNHQWVCRYSAARIWKTRHPA